LKREREREREKLTWLRFHGRLSKSIPSLGGKELRLPVVGPILDLVLVDVGGASDAMMFAFVGVV
jgi:hypothetical protein